MPANLDLAAASPLLCAGVTMWDPLRHWGFTKGDQKKTVGIIGVGGLGTMGIKLAAALGHRVVAISTSANKEALAKQKGASAFVVSSDPESMKAEAAKIDIILNTVGAPHEVSHYLSLLATNGHIVQLGLVTNPHALVQPSLIFSRLSICGSLIGGIESTQEMLDFCGKHNILPDT